MTYNMTGVENANNIADLFLGVNTATQDSYVSLAGLVLISIFFVVFIVLLRQQPAPESFLGASAVCSVASLILLAMSAVSAVWVVAFGSMLAVSAIGVYLQR